MASDKLLRVLLLPIAIAALVSASILITLSPSSTWAKDPSEKSPICSSTVGKDYRCSDRCGFADIRIFHERNGMISGVLVIQTFASYYISVGSWTLTASDQWYPWGTYPWAKGRGAKAGGNRLLIDDPPDKMFDTGEYLAEWKAPKGYKIRDKLGELQCPPHSTRGLHATEGFEVSDDR